MFDFDSANEFCNTYTATNNVTTEILNNLRAAKDTLEVAKNSMAENFSIDGVGSDNGAISKLCERINNQINDLSGPIASSYSSEITRVTRLAEEHERNEAARRAQEAARLAEEAARRAEEEARRNAAANENKQSKYRSSFGSN